ncbi:hypothetical protein T439DRAFT_323042 [Meredithblackwellia eburnea MCA 4105]
MSSAPTTDVSELAASLLRAERALAEAKRNIEQAEALNPGSKSQIALVHDTLRSSQAVDKEPSKPELPPFELSTYNLTQFGISSSTAQYNSIFTVAPVSAPTSTPILGPTVPSSHLISPALVPFDLSPKCPALSYACSEASNWTSSPEFDFLASGTLGSDCSAAWLLETPMDDFMLPSAKVAASGTFPNLTNTSPCILPVNGPETAQELDVESLILSALSSSQAACGEVATLDGSCGTADVPALVLEDGVWHLPLFPTDTPRAHEDLCSKSNNVTTMKRSRAESEALAEDGGARSKRSKRTEARFEYDPTRTFPKNKDHEFYVYSQTRSCQPYDISEKSLTRLYLLEPSLSTPLGRTVLAGTPYTREAEFQDRSTYELCDVDGGRWKLSCGQGFEKTITPPQGSKTINCPRTFIHFPPETMVTSEQHGVGSINWWRLQACEGAVPHDGMPGASGWWTARYDKTPNHRRPSRLVDHFSTCKLTIHKDSPLTKLARAIKEFDTSSSSSVSK